MDDLVIPATSSSPFVNFLAESGELELRGESYPENSPRFFRPILKWLTDYLGARTAPIRVAISLTYLNTSSVKCMMDMLDALQAAHDKGLSIVISWYYDGDNDRALDLAEEFKEELTLPFHIIPASEAT